MTKNTAHSDCTHPATKSARAACRRARQNKIDIAEIETMITTAPKRAKKSAASATRAELAEYARLTREIESAGTYCRSCLDETIVNPIDGQSECCENDVITREQRAQIIYSKTGDYPF